ncbi:hypothetical protein WA026_003184 [Henosepilachna vigintioctopunctata]|uniref:Uncharacterized protein n=1 Tax=Henosepilachna vigintioctopunctata TaxID=420089 RepID=A0AAW1TQL6_9CUCU
MGAADTAKRLQPTLISSFSRIVTGKSGERCVVRTRLGSRLSRSAGPRGFGEIGSNYGKWAHCGCTGVKDIDDGAVHNKTTSNILYPISPKGVPRLVL